jgi:hypothetical protein
MEALLTLKATNGILTVFDDHVEISRKSVMGFLSQGIKGDRVIYYSDIASVEYKKPTMMANGYIQFIITGTTHQNASVGIFGSSMESMKDPNTIILRAFNKETPELADKAYKIIMNKLNGAKTNKSDQVSSADELRKYKSLLDDGIITQDEFDKKKKDLLSL